MSGRFHEVGVVTDIDASYVPENDVCCGDMVPEVELVSLVTEQLPRYRLRADTMTEFAGYRHKDWTQGLPEGSGGTPGTPELPCNLMEIEETAGGMTNAQIEHTLDYFILCGLRVSQMTKAYYDIEAVTTLLEEKERDLELAATIGKNLLEKNKELQTQVELLEEQVRQSSEEIAQLRHELCLKDGLLRIYCEDAQEAEDLFEDHSAEASLSTSSSMSLSRVNVEHLQKKVQDLEEENMELKIEHQTLEITASNLEEKEQTLMKDCLLQLTEANQHIRMISEDLTRKTDKCMQQQEDVTSLLAKNVELEGRVKQVVGENDFLTLRLKESEACRLDLSGQLGDLRDKFDECLGMLAESQAESRDLRKQQRRASFRPTSSASSSVCAAGDLASELAMAARLLGEPDDEVEVEEAGSVRSRRVLDSVRSLRVSRRHHQLQHRPSRGPSSLASASLADNTSAAVRTADVMSCCTSVWDPDDSEVGHGGISSLPTPSEAGGDPIPGSTSFSPPPCSRGRIAAARAEKELSAGSYLSTGSGHLEGFDSASGIVHNWLSNAPDKLQIVKPLEGSETLRQWQHLATPSLSRALFDAPPVGVHVRGAAAEGTLEEMEKEEDDDDTAFSEVEEDDAASPPPTAVVPSYLASPEVSSRLSRHNISGLSPGLARVLCAHGIPSQAALAAMSPPTSVTDASPPTPAPVTMRQPSQHARLAETISKVGHRLWSALQLSASTTGAPLLASSDSSSSSSSQELGGASASLRGLDSCLGSAARPKPRVMHRTHR